MCVRDDSARAALARPLVRRSSCGMTKRAGSAELAPLNSRRTSMPIRSSTPRVPATMKAAAIDRYGPPSVLKLTDLPTPEPEADQILIAVHTAGVGVVGTRRFARANGRRRGHVSAF